MCSIVISDYNIYLVLGRRKNDFLDVDAEQSKEAPIDPELARYLNRDYWQQRKNEQRAAATVSIQNIFQAST